MTKKLIIFLVGIAIAFTAGFYWYNKPRQGVEGKAADIKINADQLWQEYQKDETGANAKFLNAVIEVEGRVSEISENENAWLIFLNPQADGSGISCLLASKSVDTSLVKTGSTVKLKGRCTGYNMDVNLTDCIIIQ